MDGPQHAEYQSYLLRLWCTEGETPWRILLERIGSGERQGFSDLESLLDFLRAQTGSVQEMTGSLNTPRSVRREEC